MNIQFYKYQATGNDFILIDNRNGQISLNKEKVAHLCNRHFGIGADGLILLESDADLDFLMVYYNSDGQTSSMCGNGGRSIVAFAKFLGLCQDQTTFMATDGVHQAKIKDDWIELNMRAVQEVEDKSNAFFLNTGSPHHVEFHDNINHLNVYELGKKIRHEVYGEEGANINFVEVVDNGSIFVRTYERGVENETLSCGTGVTAAAIASFYAKKTNQTQIKIQSLGGDLLVKFKEQENEYREVWLIGPAKQVFYGTIGI